MTRPSRLAMGVNPLSYLASMIRECADVANGANVRVPEMKSMSSILERLAVVVDNDLFCGCGYNLSACVGLHGGPLAHDGADEV